MKALVIKQVFIISILFFNIGNTAFSQKSKLYPFKSEEPFQTRIEWDINDEMLVAFMIPIAEQEDPHLFREILKEIIRRISVGELKCYSDNLRCEHMFPSPYYDRFEEALRLKCRDEYHSASPSVCDTSHMDYYGKMLWGYSIRNIKTGEIHFGKELGIVGFLDPRFPVLLTFSVDLEDIKDINIKPGLNFNTWFSEMQYFYVPLYMNQLYKNQLRNVDFCDCKDKETLSNLADTLRKGDANALEVIREKHSKCHHSGHPLEAYKFQ